MGTIAQKLTYLEDTKTAIGNAIAAKGGSVTGKTFRQYATEISNLPSGTQDLINIIEGDITTLVIPSGTTQIRSYVFRNCFSMTSVTIPDSVTSIGQSAFYQCTGLTSVVIPDSVTSIGVDSFSGCTGLTGVTVNASTPPTLGTDAFKSTNGYPIYVPSGSLTAYRTAWSSYSSRIQAIPSNN